MKEDALPVLATPDAMQKQIEQWRCAGETIGFVPTMGALHAGHLALVKRARKENSKVVVSIFVNPTQFRPGEDFQRYPRPFERDYELLQSERCDVIFSPSADAMYEGNTRTFVEVEGKAALSDLWEGAARPGHFRGVATVVSKLFNIVRAHRSYFGEKDFQQLKIIEALVRDLNFPIDVIACPTVREENGIALSSRNQYLSAREREAAPALFQALTLAQNLTQKGERNAEKLIAAMHAFFEDQPILQLEYLCVVDAQTLEPLHTLSDKKPARALIAAHAGNTRLIDNIALK